MLSKERVAMRLSQDLTIRESDALHNEINNRIAEIWWFLNSRIYVINKTEFLEHFHHSQARIDDEKETVYIDECLGAMDAEPQINDRFFPFHHKLNGDIYQTQFPLSYLWSDYEPLIISAFAEAAEKTRLYRISQKEKSKNKVENRKILDMQRKAAFALMRAKLAPEDIKLIGEVGANNAYFYLVNGDL